MKREVFDITGVRTLGFSERDKVVAIDDRALVFDTLEEAQVFYDKTRNEIRAMQYGRAKMLHVLSTGKSIVVGNATFEFREDPKTGELTDIDSQIAGRYLILLNEKDKDFILLILKYWGC